MFLFFSRDRLNKEDLKGIVVFSVFLARLTLNTELFTSNEAVRICLQRLSTRRFSLFFPKLLPIRSTEFSSVGILSKEPLFSVLFPIVWMPDVAPVFNYS